MQQIKCLLHITKDSNELFRKIMKNIYFLAFKDKTTIQLLFL